VNREEITDHEGPQPEAPEVEDDMVGSGDKVVRIAIYVNLMASAIFLGEKVAGILLTSSLLVLASLVDAALDFLSTAIVWTTDEKYGETGPIPISRWSETSRAGGVLVSSVVMVTAFVQVALECLGRLNSNEQEIIKLGLPALAIMSSTLLNALYWLWCKFYQETKRSSACTRCYDRRYLQRLKYYFSFEHLPTNFK
jgi:hypothetical protein